MTDLVDQMFPPITQKSEAAATKPEYNDFNFWRPSLSTFELPPDDELMPTPPLSPALSARSGRSVRSNASLRSATTDTAVGLKSEEEPRRRSRFGLGSLGLSRKGSAQTIDVPDTAGANASSAHPALTSPSAPDLTAVLPASRAGPHRGDSESEAATAAFGTSPTGSSYGSGATSSWIAPWRRRRAASPGDASGGGSATSPLVGPVITAEPDSDDENLASDDDVSVFGDGAEPSSSKGRQDENSRDEEDEREDDEEDDAYSNEDESMSGSVKRPDRSGRSREDEVIDDDLLAGGEIRFDWK